MVFLWILLVISILTNFLVLLYTKLHQRPNGVISLYQMMENSREKEAERTAKLIASMSKRDPVIVDPVPTIEKLGEVIAKLQGFGPGTQSNATDLAADPDGMGGTGEETYRPGFENDPWFGKWTLNKLNDGLMEGVPTLTDSVGPPLPSEQNQPAE